MSKKLVNRAYLLKILTSLVGVVGVSTLISLPAFSQSNLTPNETVTSPRSYNTIPTGPNGTIIPSANTIIILNQTVISPRRYPTGYPTGLNGTITPPAGTIIIPNQTGTSPNRTIISPNGTVISPSGWPY